MNIGFYAPLKSPFHPRPSGDRKIGRLLIKALTALGHDVEIISDLRSWEGKGDKRKQKQIQQAGGEAVKRLLKSYSNNARPDLLFTYHVYHKAPDWIGVELSSALDIPYVIAEASFAPKQENGAWHTGHEQTRRCIELANRIIAINPTDVECLVPVVSDRHVIQVLKPFLENIPAAMQAPSSNSQCDESATNNSPLVKLITVAMMREGDKTTSYKRLADSLRSLNSTNWTLTIIGDGESSAQIKAYFENLPGQCLFTGELGQQAIYNHLSASDLFVWPAVNEALGLALLEAQACGLPVIAQNYGGVSTIIEHGVSGYVTDTNDIGEFILAIEQLLNDRQTRQQMSHAAKIKFDSEHRFDVALSQLKTILNSIRTN